MKAARDKKAANAKQRTMTVNDKVEAVIADSDTSEELRRKLRYAQDVVTGQRSGDTGLMVDVRKDLMRQARRPLE